jgi:excinuclease ABC subunit C
MSVTMPDAVPKAPGVYQFLENGEVLYVGKARSLRDRLAWYFSPSSPRPARTEAMLARADTCTWTVCASESEALLLEASLISHLQPPFNVKLRADAEAYPYIILTSHEIPRVQVLHHPPRTRSRTEVFGPFPSARSARAALAALERVGVRSCSDAELATRTRAANPCMLGQLGRCSAPCGSTEARERYPEVLSVARRALHGETSTLVDAETEKMLAASEAQRFEQAARHRDTASALTALAQVQTVANISYPSLDVVAMAADQLGVAAQLLTVRNHRVVATPTYSADHVEVSTALLSLFDAASPGPPILYAGPHTSELGERTGREVIHPGTSAELLSLLALAETNAAGELARVRRSRIGSQDALDAELLSLAEVLGLASIPLRIECLDVAHLQGSHTRAAFASLHDGRVHPASSRVVKLPDLGGDDYEAISQATTKRLRAGSLPDLLVIDGGPGQLAAALRALEGTELPVCALAKRLEEVFLPHRQHPLLLPLDSPALYVLQRSRNEAHRLANAASARAARAALTRSPLEAVPGLGPRRTRRLLEAAGSQDALRSWELARLRALSWLPDNVADAVYAALHPGSPGECAGS